jgi:starch synthase
MLARGTPFAACAGQIVRWRNRRFDRFTARVVMKTRPAAVISYDTCAEQTQKAARSIKALCILDQSVGHWRSLAELVRQEAELHPEFADSMPHDLPSNFLESCTEEGLQADHVLAGSQYVKDTMVAHGVDPARVTILQYGVDVERFKPKPEANDRWFRVLFVGQLTQRKGIKYLLEAVRQLKLPRLSLTLVGGVVGSGKGLLPYRDYFKHVPSIPYDEVHRHFREADLFVYPSLHEGSALAVYEALASGLPVVTTPNSGSVVRDGIDGFIVPIRDIDSLKKAILTVWEDREMRTEMGRNARRRSQRFTWAVYRNRLGDLLHRLLDSADHSVAAPTDSSCARSIAGA